MEGVTWAANRHLPIQRWVPWVAGFAAPWIADVLTQYAPRGNRSPLICDPFAGVGTSLVEAYRLGMGVIGMELNPFAALTAQVKLAAPTLAAPDVTEATSSLIAALRQRLHAGETAVPRTLPPEGFRTKSPFFAPPVEWAIRHIRDLIDDLPSPVLRDVVRVALGAILVPLSLYTYNPSLSRREQRDRPLPDVAARLHAQLTMMAEDIAMTASHPQWQGWVAGQTRTVWQESVTNLTSYVPPATVDVVVTSPPYLNNYHYTRNTRPHLYWLGLVSSPDEVRALERDMFGGSWQQARTQPIPPLDVPLPDALHLIDTLCQKHPSAGVYGGRGWASYVATYLNASARFLRDVLTVVKPSGMVLIVIGNSVIQGIPIPTEHLIRQMAEWHGFHTVDCRCIQSKRIGSSVLATRKAMTPSTTANLSEWLIVLQRPARHV